ncbi:transcriptional regulator [Breoghania sp.]|uniref:transcriptional regulator n=2 Tax=Breoghania sp. TaxID=2065378 RepID=UPI0037489BCC
MPDGRDFAYWRFFAGFGLIAWAIVAMGGSCVQAAELIMMEQPGCVWCARFHAEIAPAYAKTEEGRRAPLRRVDITEPWPDDLSAIRPERLTPTFVLVEAGHEVARLRGYPGENFFWPMLEEMMEKLLAAQARPADKADDDTPGDQTHVGTGK